MKTLIAGSRTIDDYTVVAKTLVRAEKLLPEITTIIHGGARGVDELAGRYAYQFGGIPVEVYPADWEKFGKSAGAIRNLAMADACEQAIIIWDGFSRGTSHMIDAMLMRHKPMVLVVVPS